MISLEDCVGLCGLNEERVLAFAEHERLPEIAATALAAYLLSQNDGSEKVLDMIVDDIRASPALQTSVWFETTSANAGAVSAVASDFQSPSDEKVCGTIRQRSRVLQECPPP